MNGFIYIMSNEAFRDGRLKIGISKSDPRSERQKDLYTTGVPEPYKVEYFAFVKNYEKVEKVVHSRLSDKRPRKDREFFNCSVPESIIVIRQSAEIEYEKNFYKAPEEIKIEERRRQAEEIKRKEQEERNRILREKDAKQYEKERLRIETLKRKEWAETRNAYLGCLIPIGIIFLILVLDLPVFAWFAEFFADTGFFYVIVTFFVLGLSGVYWIFEWIIKKYNQKNHKNFNRKKDE